MSKRTIYILSEYFAPFQNIGSIKFTKIAKYLSENAENAIFVFSQKWYKHDDIFLMNDLDVMRKNGTKIFYIDEGLMYSFGIAKVRNFMLLSSMKLLGNERFYYESNQRASRKFTKKGLAIIKEQKLPAPDLILSTFDGWGGHCLAKEIKGSYPSAIWVADFRDPVGAYIKAGKYRELCDEYSLTVSRHADYITAVSRGCLDALKLTQGTQSDICTNGFDFADYEFLKKKVSGENASAQFSCKGKLRFTYTGSFYGTSLMPFFNAIKELLDEGKLSAENIEIDYAGTYNIKISEEIRKAGLEHLYRNWGKLSRFDAVRLQDESDILLTAVWNYKNSQGVIGGKVLGYLMLKKPIIAVVMGDAPDSELKGIIQRINCGWCYEEANHETDFRMLKNIIMDLYDKKMNGTPISIEYDDVELEKFNLKNIALRYEQLYERIRKERKKQ